MTDELDNPFTAVAIADLPKNTPKGADPATIALGTALLSVVDGDTAARDSNLYDLRPDAIKRANAIKRAVKAAGGTPAGQRLATQILPEGDGYRVVARLAPEAKAKAKAK
jgi:hypothetical protein